MSGRAGRGNLLCAEMCAQIKQTEISMRAGEQTSHQVVPRRQGSRGVGSCPAARPYSEIRGHGQSSLRLSRGCAPDAFRSFLPVEADAGRVASPRVTFRRGSSHSDARRLSRPGLSLGRGRVASDAAAAPASLTPPAFGSGAFSRGV
jgi:hypothetical protein